MIHLIGLAHRAQSWKPQSERTEAQEAFEHVLRRAIECWRPVLIAEEDSEEALADHQTASIAKEIALQEKIEHRFCDPTQDERRAIGYRDRGSLALDISMSESADLSGDEINLKAQAIEIARYFPIREQFWLERIAGFRDGSVIFICGDGHIESFGRLLDCNGVPYRVAHRGIGLSDEDRWFEKARHYLMEHPEIANE
jgi:hypothetical protein